MFLTLFPLLMPKDQIAPFDLRSFLKIDGIDSLSSIFEKSNAIESIEFSRSNRSFDLRSQKTIDSTEKPMIECPTLLTVLVHDVTCTIARVYTQYI